jgi:mannose-1-phosphate guanylyltransferase
VSQSGIVVLDNHGRIRKIIEKPKNEEAVSHWVNAGLYLLEPQVFKYIPPSKKVDFGMDVFPSMLQEGGKLFGFCFYLPLTAIDTPQLLKEALS